MKYCKLYQDDIKRVTDCIVNRQKLFSKRILITGASGLIGSAVADVLLYLNKEEQAGIQIILAGRNKERIINRFNIFNEGVDYEYVHYDATKGFDERITANYIVHGASNVDPKKVSAQPVETMLSNIIGINALFAHSSETSRLLYIYSSEVYGKKEDHDPYKEEEYGFVDILNPRASYPSSKRAAETLCAAYAKEHGRDFVIVRPGHIYGPTATKSDSRASSIFPYEVIAGENIVMKSAGAQLRSYCYCLDCASAILSVLTSGVSGNAYNISNKNSVVTIRQMAEAFAKAGNKDVVFEVPTAEEKASYNLMDNSSLNSHKLESLGWHACFTMEEGAQHTLDILSQNS